MAQLDKQIADLDTGEQLSDEKMLLLRADQLDKASELRLFADLEK